jgi:hypothetical protein
VPSNSKVTFYVNNRAIPGCRRVSSVSTTASCSWKPSAHGTINVRISYTTSGSATVNWAPDQTMFIAPRLDPR